MTRRSSRKTQWTSRRIWVVTHRWMGLIAALPLLIVSITGCVLAFAPELRRFSRPDVYAIEPDGEPASAESVLRHVAERWPTAHLAHTAFPHTPHEPYLIFANRPAPDGGGREGFRLLINPYTLEIHDERGRGGWVGWMEGIHRNLTLGQTGRWITALSSLVLLVLMVSGLVAWWPMRRGTLRRLRRGRNVLAWHNALGLFSAPIILLLAITGVSFLFGWAVFPAAEALTNSSAPQPKPVSRSAADQPTLSAAQAVAHGRRHVRPTERITALGMPGDSGGIIQLHLTQEDALNHYGWRRLYLDRASGEFLGREDYWQQGLGSAYRRSFWAWHAGILLGLPGRAAWALASGALAGLIATGAWWWWRKRKRPRPSAV